MCGDATLELQRRRAPVDTGAPLRPTDLTKACWAGGTIQIYINPTGCRSTAQPTWPTYEQVRTAIRNAFDGVTDPANPGKQVVQQDHEQGGAAQRRWLRLAPSQPQRRRRRRHAAAVSVGRRRRRRQAIALSHFFGQHGYLPDYVDLANNINMHAMFVLAARA